MQENINTEHKMCKCGKHRGHKEWGWALIVFGFLFLAGVMEWVPQDFVAVAWPILFILIGIKKLLKKHMCMCAHKN